MARGFARHLRAFDPATEVPPARLLTSRSCRAVPYLYSEAGIATLMRTASSLRPALRAATCQALTGLMFTTGMRIGEAIRLDRDDPGQDQGLLTVWQSKFGKSRELPLHPSALAALSTCASQREQLCPDPRTAGFFVSPAGTRLVLVTVQRAFSRLVRQAGLTARSPQCRPRLHDLRHSFACRVVPGWYRDGLDVDAQMPRLSTSLGHAGPSCTCWYLPAVPELLALAAGRRDRIPGRRA